MCLFECPVLISQVCIHGVVSLPSHRQLLSNDSWINSPTALDLQSKHNQFASSVVVCSANY